VTPSFAEETRAKSHGKGLDSNLEEFGDDKVAKFVKNNCRSEYEDESERIDYKIH
jgi:hypothetical protein